MLQLRAEFLKTHPNQFSEFDPRDDDGSINLSAAQSLMAIKETLTMRPTSGPRNCILRFQWLGHRLVVVFRITHGY